MSVPDNASMKMSLDTMDQFTALHETNRLQVLRRTRALLKSVTAFSVLSTYSKHKRKNPVKPKVDYFAVYWKHVYDIFQLVEEAQRRTKLFALNHRYPAIPRLQKHRQFYETKDLHGINDFLRRKKILATKNKNDDSADDGQNESSQAGFIWRQIKQRPNAIEKWPDSESTMFRVAFIVVIHMKEADFDDNEALYLDAVAKAALCEHGAISVVAYNEKDEDDLLHSLEFVNVQTEIVVYGYSAAVETVQKLDMLNFSSKLKDCGFSAPFYAMQPTILAFSSTVELPSLPARKGETAQTIALSGSIVADETVQSIVVDEDVDSSEYNVQETPTGKQRRKLALGDRVRIKTPNPNHGRIGVVIEISEESSGAPQFKVRMNADGKTAHYGSDQVIHHAEVPTAGTRGTNSVMNHTSPIDLLAELDDQELKRRAALSQQLAETIQDIKNKEAAARQLPGHAKKEQEVTLSPVKDFTLPTIKVDVDSELIQDASEPFAQAFPAVNVTKPRKTPKTPVTQTPRTANALPLLQVSNPSSPAVATNANVEVLVRSNTESGISPTTVSQQHDGGLKRTQKSAPATERPSKRLEPKEESRKSRTSAPRGKIGLPLIPNVSFTNRRASVTAMAMAEIKTEHDAGKSEYIDNSRSVNMICLEFGTKAAANRTGRYPRESQAAVQRRKSISFQHALNAIDPRNQDVMPLSQPEMYKTPVAPAGRVPRKQSPRHNIFLTRVRSESETLRSVLVAVENTWALPDRVQTLESSPLNLVQTRRLKQAPDPGVEEDAVEPTAEVTLPRENSPVEEHAMAPFANVFLPRENSPELINPLSPVLPQMVLLLPPWVVACNRARGMTCMQMNL